MSWVRFATVSVVCRFELILRLPLLLETLDKRKMLLVISYLLLLVSSISCLLQEYYKILCVGIMKAKQVFHLCTDRIWAIQQWQFLSNPAAVLTGFTTVQVHWYLVHRPVGNLS